MEKRVLQSALAAVFSVTLLGAQSEPGSRPQHQPKLQGSAPDKSAAAKGSAQSAQPPHLELAPVSTSETARGAAREISKRQATPAAKSADAKATDNESQLGAPDSSAVDEFKPGQAGATDDAVVVKQSKKSAAKNIHGSAYGGLDPAARGNHEAGGSVGTTSKSGKTSVYVETDSSRANSSSH